MRDFQRQKVYNWESAQNWCSKTRDLSDLSITRLTKEEMTLIVEKLNDVFLLNVQISFRKDGRKSYYAPREKRISICMSWGNNWAILLHEYAHAIISEQEAKTSTRFSDHGPEFVTVYCRLLHHVHPDYPSFRSLADSLREAGVQFNSLSASFKEENRLRRLLIDLTYIPVHIRDRFAPKEVSPHERRRRAAFSKISRIKRKYPLIKVENEGYNDDPQYYVYLYLSGETEYFHDKVREYYSTSYAYDVFELLERLESYVKFIEGEDWLIAYNDIANEERRKNA